MGGQREERHRPESRSVDTYTQSCDKEMMPTTHLHLSNPLAIFSGHSVIHAYQTRQVASSSLLYTLTTSRLGI